MPEYVLPYANTVLLFLLAIIGYLIKGKIDAIDKNIAGIWTRLEEHNTRLSRLEGSARIVFKDK